MGKADFGAIDGTISGGFDNSKKRCKVRVAQYAVDDCLTGSQRGIDSPTCADLTFTEPIVEV